MASKYFQEIEKNNPKHLEIFANKSLDIIEHIYSILKSKGLSQKDLADMLDKQESEISKWLSGGHNITLMTVSKIEEVLNESILIIPKKDAENEKKNDTDNSTVQGKCHSQSKIVKSSLEFLWKVDKYKKLKRIHKANVKPSKDFDNGSCAIKEKREVSLPKASNHTYRDNLKPLKSYS